MRCSLIILIAISFCFGAAQIDSTAFKKVRSDSIYSLGNNLKRIKNDTIYSKLDTAHIGRFDTLNINQELMFPLRWDDVGDIKLDKIRETGTSGVPDWNPTGLGFNKNQYAINDSSQGSSELFHKFKEGDSTEFHLHWYKNSNEAGATFVNWSLRYWLFNANDSITYTGILTHQDTIAANTKVMTHTVTTFGTVYTPNIKIGAKIVIMLKRIAASPATNPAADPFGSTVGCHKKINTVGSHTIYVK